MKSGRPTKKTQNIINEIIDRISEGEPLRKICREKKMPGFRTVYDWLDSDKDFSARFARARDAGYDQIAEDCLEIADDCRNDWMLKHNKDGGEYYEINGEHISRSKLRVWTRLQLLSKWSNKYSDKFRAELTGKDGGAIIIRGDDANL